MKKITLFFISVIFVVAASNADLIKASLFSLIVELLNRDNPYVQIYINSKEYQNIPKYIKKFKFTNNCVNADIIFVDSLSLLQKECIYDHKIFVTSYYDFVHNKDKVIGAFFWQKGRPTIIFNKKMLEYFGVKLPPKYNKYID
ncbi:hypothetical protein [Nitratiruptor sp. YY09-18]|uniref:hypothetical protein n=1 Tax=Nitratiruptor sp. YY09-18 TaxID=2724901 RepID=UPI001915EAE3|nr:hypothetical protein [Nitratiruptor sp. YY09-18]BCD68086.1 hypothetical protein NitYY0918_C0997 [Nitratiruptor sp. YY09-18]